MNILWRRQAGTFLGEPFESYNFLWWLFVLGTWLALGRIFDIITQPVHVLATRSCPRLTAHRIVIYRSKQSILNFLWRRQAGMIFSTYRFSDALNTDRVYFIIDNFIKLFDIELTFATYCSDGSLWLSVYEILRNLNNNLR